ncbi:DnaT-like ssDNA-binding domain-containing protein [Atlantibacter hermannii]|uniref:DnaT-like ssDNA-binding domain-containing protein n=1 Tax=Atlantibacter hermannii TaxID=565 RepID=UPI0028AC7A80|nr:DnaT-like ssDNA-binding domain-containing protein [Atlantibacter hermannii]
MARIRTVKPEFWTDEKVVECSISARLLFIGLFNFADDKGCLERSPKRIKMQVFPADTIDCEPLIMELIAHGLLTEYSVNGSHYLQIPGFLKHQKINRPSNSNIPLPPQPNEQKPPSDDNSLKNEADEHADSVRTQEGFTEKSLNTHGGLTDGREGKGRERKGIKQEREDRAPEEIQDEENPEAEYEPPLGKFTITAGWKPAPEFERRAALWGIVLGEAPGYTPEELQQFRDYWSVEGRVKHHQQWEQTFAQSLRSQREQAKRSTGRQKTTAFAIPQPDNTIPDGFTG